MDVLKEEYEALIETKDKAKDDLRALNRRWRKSPNYSWTKLPNGKANVEAFFSIFLLVVLTASLVAVITIRELDSFTPGEELADNAAYTCEECEWQGEPSEMVGHGGEYHTFLYCPECGEFMGWRAAGDDL